MTTITEDFVSFETAKLLKEKNCPDFGYSCICDSEGNKAQTQSIIMKWLRIKHHIDIEVNVYSKDHVGLLNYFFEIRKNGSLLILDDVNHVRDNYEEAVEAAIEYCLKNLI